MQNPVVTVLISILTIIVIVNLVLLNYTVFRIIPTRVATSPIAQSPLPSSIPVTSDFPNDTCGVSCQKAIQVALTSVDAKIATLSTLKTRTASKPGATSTPVPAAKEFFIPLGSGSTTKSDWEDVAGTDVYVDTANFPNIKQTYFEVSMHIPTKNGTMYARLYNVTDKHPVWNSDVSTIEDTSTFTTAKIMLDPGNKLYRVQMRTTLQYPSLLDNARIKILIQ